VDKKGFIKFNLGVHLGYDDQILINGQGEDFLITGDLGLKLTDKIRFSFIAAHSIPLATLLKAKTGTRRANFMPV